MAYKTMNATILKEIIRRHSAGQKHREIGRILKIDHHTVSKYISKANELIGKNLSAFLQQDDWAEKINDLVEQCNYRKHYRAPHELDKYKDEIQGHLSNKDNPLIPKSIYDVLKEKYAIKSSYSSFKRYFRKQTQWQKKTKTPIRIEAPPGNEIQVDYGFAGYHVDPSTGRKRKVHAFCARLSYCRLPFIQFVYSQNQTSFVQSHVDMFDFFEGTTERIIIDNLKSGVLKPSLYDPLINRAFRDMAEHYNVFIDPARVATPTDKGKVERGVPQAKELFRKLVALEPSGTLSQYNKRATHWCKEEYGRRPHGTTGIPPMDLFQLEKEHFVKLPTERFAVPEWKKVKVHRDQFFVYNKKRYSMPEQFISCTVDVKHDMNSASIDVYIEEKHLRTYLIPKGWYRYEKADFPKIRNEFMESNYSGYLLREAEKCGDACQRLVKNILGVKAFLNCRRVRAVIDFVKDHQHETLLSRALFEANRLNIYSVQGIKATLKDTQDQIYFDETPFPQSDEAASMTRPTTDYI